MIGDIPKFILPSPLNVAKQLGLLLQEDRLARHFFLTLSEVLMGLFLGVLIATPLGYLLVKSPLAEKLFSPYLIASQAIPVIAIAPLLTIWIRDTYWMRVVVAVLVVFFPVAVNVIAGLRTVPDELYELMRSLNASKWDIFRKVELPASMPVLLAGLKVGATLSVIGALVGEFIQPKSEGLGFMLVNARFQFKTDEVFAVLIILGAMALALYGLISLLEIRLLKWQTKK